MLCTSSSHSLLLAIFFTSSSTASYTQIHTPILAIKTFVVSTNISSKTLSLAMADLLDSLLPPLHSSQPSTTLGHQSSNESFHSTTSQARPKNTASALAVRDINEYLNDPTNATLLAGGANQQKANEGGGSLNDPMDIEPIPLESSSSGFVSALNELCQGKGIPMPMFNLEQRGEGHFTEIIGTVQIGDMVLADPKVYRNKKAAREGLSELALPKAKEMPSRRHEEQTSNTNKDAILWIQRLNEYLLPNCSAPKYQTFALGLQFSVVLTFSLYPDHAFGSKTTPFASKKDAQTAAAKEAVLFLINQGHLDENGRPAKKRKATANTSPIPNRKAGASSYGTLRFRTFDDGAKCIEVPKSMTSITQRTAELAILLGLMPPQYHLVPATPQTASILNGHAVIGNAGESGLPGVTGPIGKVEQVFGKTAAKSEIAGQVWEVLVQAARTRGFEVQEVES